MFYFVKEYMVKGMASLPVHKYDRDLCNTDEEFEEYVKEKYHKKPEGHEQPLGNKITAKAHAQKRGKKKGKRNGEVGRYSTSSMSDDSVPVAFNPNVKSHGDSQKFQQCYVWPESCCKDVALWPQALGPVVPIHALHAQILTTCCVHSEFHLCIHPVQPDQERNCAVGLLCELF